MVWFSMHTFTHANLTTLLVRKYFHIMNFILHCHSKNDIPISNRYYYLPYPHTAANYRRIHHSARCASITAL